MSIGRIRTTTPTTQPSSGTTPAAKPATPFETGAAEAVNAVAAPSLLAALREGTLDRDGYIDAHVEAAMAHLGSMPAKDQESIRAQLRERCESDPVLTDLIARATKPAAP